MIAKKYIEFQQINKTKSSSVARYVHMKNQNIDNSKLVQLIYIYAKLRLNLRSADMLAHLRKGNNFFPREESLYSPILDLMIFVEKYAEASLLFTIVSFNYVDLCSR